jgi:hypothetical protein
MALTGWSGHIDGERVFAAAYVNIATTAGFDIGNPHTEIWQLKLPP